MSTVLRPAGHRVDPTPFTALVALGDLFCIGAFVFVGTTQGHGYDPAVHTGRIVGTFLQFGLGWLVTSVAAGVYAADARTSARRAVARTVPAWIGAAVIVQGLRAMPVFHGGAALTFFLVSVAVGLALLVPWRLAVVVLQDR